MKAPYTARIPRRTHRARITSPTRCRASLSRRRSSEVGTSPERYVRLLNFSIRTILHPVAALPDIRDSPCRPSELLAQDAAAPPALRLVHQPVGHVQDAVPVLRVGKAGGV